MEADCIIKVDVRYDKLLESHLNKRTRVSQSLVCRSMSKVYLCMSTKVHSMDLLGSVTVGSLLS